MNNNDVKKVLLINFGGIGDEILFFPTVKSVKATYPNAKIHLVLENRSKAAKQLCPDIDEIIGVNIKSKGKYFEALKLLFKIWTKHYDIVFSAGSSTFVSLFLFLTGIKKRYGYDSGKLSQTLLTATAKLNKQQYAANMYHDLIKITNPDANCSIPEISGIEAKKTNSTKPVILIHPGVSLMSIKKNIIKGWDVKKWAKLIDNLLQTKQYTVILAGGKDDEETIEEILFVLNATRTEYDDFINLYGKTRNIQDFIGHIKAADILVCVDSAPLHMAIGTNTPVVALFGPTDEKKLVPQRDNIRVLTVKDLPCRPCLWDKRATSCETKECLNIHTADVLDAIESMLVK